MILNRKYRMRNSKNAIIMSQINLLWLSIRFCEYPNFNRQTYNYVISL